MIRRLLISLVFAAISVPLFSQTTFLSFSATLNGQAFYTDSIRIENLTQPGTRMLYGFDTIFMLDAGVGFLEISTLSGENEVTINAYPNPTSSHSDLIINTFMADPLRLRITDLSGKSITKSMLLTGKSQHHLRFYPSGKGIYFVKLEYGQVQQVVKIISQSGRSGPAILDQVSSMENSIAGKVQAKSTISFLWSPGDQLRFTGYTTGGSAALLTDTIYAAPFQSANYTFNFTFPSSPPQASFIASDTLLLVNDTVHFTDLSSGNPSMWKWKFGSGDSSALQHPAYVYQSPGLYNITLIVSNNHGSDTLVKTAYIQVVQGSQLKPVYDIDGNGYDTVHIGNQVWFRENLRTTRYNDGSLIPLVTANSAWTALSTGARCWYNNDSVAYGGTYGALYNWYAVNEGNICPAGWHVPSDAEWSVLISYLGGENMAGGAMKEAGTTHWNSPNTGATNSSGFTALPAGNRNGSLGGYSGNGSFAHYWSSTPNLATSAWMRWLYYYDNYAGRGQSDRRSGHGIRCIKD